MKRKIWLAPLSVISLSATAIAAVSCGNGNKVVTSVGGAVNEAILKNAKSSKDLFNVDNFNNKNVKAPIDFANADAKLKLANVNRVGKFTELPYMNDTTWEYGGYQNHVFETAAGYLVRKEFLFQPIIETKRESLSQVSYAIKRPSIWRYKLGYVSKVIVTREDGKVVEFDNDYIDTYPDYDDKVNKTFNLLSYQGIAKDDGVDGSKARRSINGEYFFKSLVHPKKLQFAIKHGQKWVDNQGNETKYEVVPEDFYLSYVRTFLHNVWYRKQLLDADGIVSKDLDDEILTFLPDGVREFTKDRKYANYYLWDLYGFNGDNLLDESKFIQDYNGEKVLTFVDNNSFENPIGGKSLFDALAIIKDFSAFPSQYVKDHQQNPLLKNYKNKPQAEYDAFINKVKGIPNNNLVSRTGLYWYGSDPNNLLFAGAYYYAGYSTSTQKESWKINSHFVNQDFVKNPNTIKQIDVRYSNSTQAQNFRDQVFDDYKKGKAIGVAYSELTENQLKEVNSNPDSYGINYFKSINNNNILSELQYRLIPGNVDTGFDVNFNEPFAKLFWGSNAQMNNLGNLSGINAYKDIISGYGLSFRSIITAAYNWDYSALYISNNKKSSWIAGFAPDSQINGSDAQPGSRNFVSTYADQINSLFALDKDLHKIDFGNGDTDITSDENLKASQAESSDEKKLHSAEYEKLSEAMTALLDDFYAKNPSYHPDSNNNDKIKFSYVWRWTDWEERKQYQSLWNNGFIKKNIEGLDKKHRIEVSMKFYDAQSNLDNWKHSFPITRSNSAFAFDGWGYDYDGFGSALDGKSSIYTTPALILIGQSTDLQNKLEPIFPEMVKAGKAIVQFIKDNVAKGRFKLSIPLDKFADLPARLLAAAYYNFTTYHYNSATNTFDTNNTDPDLTDFASINSLFWLEYSSKITNEENMKLAKEFTNFSGPVIDSARSYAKNFAPNLVNPHFRTPFRGTDEKWYQDIRIWE